MRADGDDWTQGDLLSPGQPSHTFAIVITRLSLAPGFIQVLMYDSANSITDESRLARASSCECYGDQNESEHE